jgi:hypothetical protein
MPATLNRRGLSPLADLRLQDYRDIRDEPFDAIVSIEMFEAVGREYWDSYFHLLQRQLKPGGKACIQTITIRDDLFERYVRSTDFIQQYIFPGGLLPSCAAFRAQAAPGRPGGGQRTGLRRRLCRDAAPLARAASWPRRRRAQARLRHALHAHLGVLPGLLPGGLRRPATPASCSSRCAGPEPCCSAVALLLALLAPVCPPGSRGPEAHQAPPKWRPNGRGAPLWAADAALPRPARVRRAAVVARPTGRRRLGPRPFALELVYARRCRARRSPSAHSPRCAARACSTTTSHGTLAGGDDGCLSRRRRTATA